MDDDKITSFVTARESLREYIADCDKRLSEIAAERDRALEELGESVEPKEPPKERKKRKCQVCGEWLRQCTCNAVPEPVA